MSVTCKECVCFPVCDECVFRSFKADGCRNFTRKQRWILTSKKPPTKKDANAHGLVLSVAFGDVMGVNPWYVVKACPEELPLWMSLPELPKEGE